MHKAILPILAAAIAQVATAQSGVRYKVSLPQPDTEVGQRQAVSQTETTVPSARHLLLQFDEAPTAVQVDDLKRRGVRVLLNLPDNGLLVSTAQPLDLSGIGVRSAGPVNPLVKRSPLIGADTGGDFVVEFHPDVNMNEARSLVLGLGLELHENPDVGPKRLLIRSQMRARAADPLKSLAVQDEVAYLFPASKELVQGLPVIPCMSAVSDNGILAQYIATMGNGWDGEGLGSIALAYVWGNSSSRLPPSLAKPEIIRAMDEWSKIAAISWTEGTDAAATKTVHILFGSGSHGDPYPFDGPGNVLAHTFYPSPPNPEPIAGDMHLDDDEDWRVGANLDLYSVALHELGHALGLGHSDDPTAVMYPYYRIVSSLQTDDHNAILTLYAAALTEQPQPADTTAPLLTILSPSKKNTTTKDAWVTISGTAEDAGGLAMVTWTNSLGASGAATGTTRWSATVPLQRGANLITIRAVDRAGNEASKAITVRSN